MSSISGFDRQRLLPPALEARLIGTLGRGCGVLLCVILAAVWASMVSWSVVDPSLSHATDGPVRNALGSPGAIIADLMIQTLGLASAVILLPLMIWAFELVLSERVAEMRTKAIFFPFAVLGVAGALASLPRSPSWPIEPGYGGILGDALFGAVSSVLSVISSDTSGIAAAILLIGAGLSSLAQSLGISRADIFPRRLPNLPGAQEAATWGHEAAAWGRNSAAQLAARIPRQGSLAAALDAFRTFGSSPALGMERFGFGRSEPVLPGLFARRQEPSLSDDRYAAPRPHFEPRRPMQNEFDYMAEDLDVTTGEHDMLPAEDNALKLSSRAIAERFAPANGRPLPFTQNVEITEPGLAAPVMPDNDLPRFLTGAREAAQPKPVAASTPQNAPKGAPAGRRVPAGIARAMAARRGERSSSARPRPC